MTSLFFQPGFIKQEKKYKILKTITIKRNTFFQLNQVFILFFLLKVTQFNLPERQPQWLRPAENHLIFMTWPKLKSHLKTSLLLFNAWFPNYGDGEAMAACRQYFSLIRTLIASIDIHDLQSLCELHKPRLLSPLTTLYRAGCHALWPQLIPEYLLVKDPHGPPLGSLCSVCQWTGVGVLYPFYPISL